MYMCGTSIPDFEGRQVKSAHCADMAHWHMIQKSDQLSQLARRQCVYASDKSWFKID